jgi:hypothetical protein
MLKKIAMLAVFALLSAPILSAIDLPKPPPGFTWQEIPELKAAFLKPDGWFFKRESEKGTLAYFITKEDLSKTGEFNTGMTVNVFHLKVDSAVDHGKDMIEQMGAKNHAKTWTQVAGPFKEFGCEMNVTDASGTFVMHALTIANPKTNTLYLFMFESPSATWDEAWMLGKQIMDTLAIDDGV